jgi:hypothetical protein
MPLLSLFFVLLRGMAVEWDCFGNEANGLNILKSNRPHTPENFTHTEIISGLAKAGLVKLIFFLVNRVENFFLEKLNSQTETIY